MKNYGQLITAFLGMLTFWVIASPAYSEAENFTTVNMRSVVNMGWKDEHKAGTRGWTGQGDNDMRNVQPGLQKLLGIPFDLIDAAQNDGRGVLTLKSRKFALGAASAELAVNAHAGGIYFLHASAWTIKDVMATYTVQYEDGTSVEIPIRGSEEINDWWEPVHGKQCRIALQVPNPQYDNLGLLAFGWTNPNPDKTIKSIFFKSAGTDGIVIITAVTLTDKPAALPDPKDIKPPEYMQGDEMLLDKSQWFPVEIKKDPFDHTCIDQLPNLDAPAGKHGFQKNVDGRWVFEDGTPCRMAAVMNNPPDTKDEAKQMARFLAKYGITMVRMGHFVTGPSDDSIIDWRQPDTQHLNAKYLDKLDFFISELAKNGIYSRFTTFWYRKMKKGDNIEGFDEAIAYDHKQNNTMPDPKKEEFLNSCGITFFQPRVMELNIELEKAFLTHKNPYRDNKMYGEDPAICQIEVTNEDGVFFWTFDGIPPVYVTLLNKLWIEFLQKKYGTSEKLAQAWGNELSASESFAAGKINRILLGNITDHTAETRPHRLRDQMEFYTQLESGYFNKTKEALRAAGVKQPICGSGWFGAQNTFFADIWANANGMDYIDRHHYYGGGIGGSFLIKGYPSLNVCALTKPEFILSPGTERVIGMPYTISEWNFELPGQFFLECAPLMAFYGNSLGGWDAPIHFAWWGNGFSTIGFPWPLNVPSVLCQYPALSQMIRNADIKAGPDAYIRHLSDDQVLSGKSLLDALVRMDISGPFQNLSTAQQATARNLAVTYSAAVGRTGILFTGRQESTDYSIDLGKYLSLDKKEILSATGELYWNYGKGYVTADAPRMQAAVGFITNIPIKLRDCEIQTSNMIASVMVAPLDNEPLASSKHILITAIGRCRNTGMSYSRSGWRVVSGGKAPPCLEGVKGTVTLNRGGKCAVTALDPYGYRTTDVPARFEGGHIVIPMDGQYKAAYYEVVLQ